MSKIKIIIAAVLILGIAACGVGGVRVSLTPDTVKAEATFDHSNCQYPDRWSNPVDGCDNSDPAVPECIKGATTQEAEQTCIDAFVKAHSDPSTNLPSPDQPYYDAAGNEYDYQGNLIKAAPVEAVKPTSCTGK